MYRKDGYQIVKNVFSNDDLTAFRLTTYRLLETEFKRIGRKFDSSEALGQMQVSIDNAVSILADDYRDVFDEFLDRASSTLSFHRLISSLRLETVVNECLEVGGEKPLCGQLNKLRILMPNTNIGRVDWHREIFQTVPRSRFVQIWAPIFRSADTDNGALQILEGSHLAKLPKPEWQENKNGVSLVRYPEQNLSSFDAMSITLKEGEALMFDGNLVHRSGINCSQFPRYSIVGLYHDAEDPAYVAPRLPVKYREETPREYHSSLPESF